MVYVDGQIPAKDLCFSQAKLYQSSSLHLHFSLNTVVGNTRFSYFSYSDYPSSPSPPSNSLFQNPFFALLKFLRNKHHKQHHADGLYSPLSAKWIQNSSQELPKVSTLVIIKGMHGQSYEWKLPRNWLCCAHLSLLLSSLQLHFPNIMKQIKSAFSASISSMIN